MKCKVFFRFYEELNDYLPPERRKVTFSSILKGPTIVKEAIRTLGVPPEEVDLVLVNGKSVTFDHIIAEGDTISIYPIFESLDISNVTKLRDKPLIKLVQGPKNRNPERS
jgi:sulfur carrier protein ThiS